VDEEYERGMDCVRLSGGARPARKTQPRASWLVRLLRFLRLIEGPALHS
jgi:hypothetical protein